MATKTFIPAFEARVGDWKYYICIMKYAQVAREVQFAHQLGGNKDLDTLIQRGISARTDDIKDYLLRSEHRFLGAIIIAAWGGAPEYLGLRMDDSDGILQGVDSGFGVLTFDGSQQFFALDGQHRLRAIKDAVLAKPELGSEDLCVLVVSHLDTSEGRERTQRLFTNINRNAKVTTSAENIALDVDDAFAVTTRRLLTEHPFLSVNGRVKVFTKFPNEDGEFTLASSSIPKGDKKALTTITVLYEITKLLVWDEPSALLAPSVRPDDDVLERIYQAISSRIDDLLESCGNVMNDMKAVASANLLRAPVGAEGSGHAMMRPVIQKAVVRALHHIMEQQSLDWKTCLVRISELPWHIDQAPWLAVFNPVNCKMVTAKENADLLEELLIAHIAPTSKNVIARARKNYREIRNSTYPVSALEMEEALI